MASLDSPILPFAYPNALQAALPMGGIGAGCFCLNGSGGFQDFSLRHHPETTALPDGHNPSLDAVFAILHLKGGKKRKPATRLVEGPLPPEKIYDQGLQSQGYRHGGYEGLPRFARSRFAAGYPFGKASLSDPALPLEVDVLGFNPFIPLDAKNSGIPCALLEYTVRNRSRETVSFEFSFHMAHPAPGQAGAQTGEASRTRPLGGHGIYFYNTDPADGGHYGSAALIALKGRPRIKAMWFRGGWFDGISQLWKEVSTGSFQPNTGHNGIDLAGRNGGSLLFSGTLKAKASATHLLAVCWHFPNACLSAGWPEKNGGEGCCPPAEAPAWRPWYAGVWKDAEAVAGYVRGHYVSLRRRTVAFNHALFSGTLPPEVLDAVSANLAILKSPTVLRQENGNLWGWEGCFTNRGCCPGSCTHVWNYAQSLCHLFPELERTLRHQELERSMDERGHINFRATLPDGPATHGSHAAADGQLGGHLKLYRDWQISGDTAWMRGLYPLARKSLEYAIETWDPRREGVLSEPHHNTYDIEFWGPDPLCSGIYIAALSAMARMAEALERPREAEECRNLAEKGARFLERELFNGEYLHQKVQWENLRDRSLLEFLADPSRSAGLEGTLLRKEGPKYQYGSGCLSDAVLGLWMAKLYGVDTPLDPSVVRSTLRAIHRHNFRSDLSTHANCQRPGYALGREAGLLLCSWPRGGKPTLPFVYSDEVWTGIEYQVASHLIEEGFVKEGLGLVKAVRRRYQGRVRNPFNEYECGSYYARAMASYALLGSFSGFRYSALEQTLWFGPRTKTRPFSSFFSTAKGWGTITLHPGHLDVSVIEGSLPLKRLVLRLGKEIREIKAGKTVKWGKSASFPLST
jgi:uncharacterized protein (DUF608 family)